MTWCLLMLFWARMSWEDPGISLDFLFCQMITLRYIMIYINDISSSHKLTSWKGAAISLDSLMKWAWCTHNSIPNLSKSCQGWAGIPVSRDSREYKPQISLPFPWHFEFPFPFPRKESFGRELGRKYYHYLQFWTFSIVLTIHEYHLYTG